jgi:hypothetical protein
MSRSVTVAYNSAVSNYSTAGNSVTVVCNRSAFHQPRLERLTAINKKGQGVGLVLIKDRAFNFQHGKNFRNSGNTAARLLIT